MPIQEWRTRVREPFPICLKGLAVCDTETCTGLILLHVHTHTHTSIIHDLFRCYANQDVSGVHNPLATERRVRNTCVHLSTSVSYVLYRHYKRDTQLERGARVSIQSACVNRIDGRVLLDARLSANRAPYLTRAQPNAFCSAISFGCPS